MTEGPRYRQVADALRASIEAGAYPVGAFLPPEVDLCAAFGISRHTAREALRRLAEAGLIQRRQGSGSQVVATQAPAAYVHAIASGYRFYSYGDAGLWFSPFPLDGGRAGDGGGGTTSIGERGDSSLSVAPPGSKPPASTPSPGLSPTEGGRR